MSEPYLTTDLSAQSDRARNRRRAEKLLADFRRGDPVAITLFRQNHPQGQEPDFQPELIDARIVTVSDAVQAKPLSLETLKKRAKRLLKAWRAGEGDALARAEVIFTADRLPAPTEARLADAQFIIARELGLKSWPRLKAHLQAMDAAASALRQPVSPHAADQDVAHVRCGSDIGEALPAAGLKGPFFNFEEVYVCGPLIGGADDDIRPFLRRRAEYLSSSFPDVPHDPDRDMSVDGVLAALERDRRRIDELAGTSNSLSLWFEHDAHDQFMLAALLHQLSTDGGAVPRLQIISPDRFPGVDRFMGLGQLSGNPASLRMLWDQRVDVMAAEIMAGAEIWRAACDPDPSTLWSVARAASHPLRHMPGALRWHLAQLPHIAHGLSGVEWQMLQVVAGDGPLTPGRIFALHLYEADPLPTLGDLVFFNILDGLIHADRPALEYLSYDPDELPHRRGDLALTEVGHALLAGDVDWLDLNLVDRWVGGVHVRSGQRNWRWDPALGPVLR